MTSMPVHAASDATTVSTGRVLVLRQHVAEHVRRARSRSSQAKRLAALVDERDRAELHRSIVATATRLQAPPRAERLGRSWARNCSRYSRA